MKTYVRRAHDPANLFHRVQIGAQPAVHRKDLLINDRRNGKAVEAVGKRLPQLDVVTALAFIVETVDTVDRGTLVVSAEDEEVLRVFYLVGEEQANGFQRLLASVDIIAKKQVVSLRRESSVLEEAQQVVVLSVDIAADLAGREEDTSVLDALRKCDSTEKGRGNTSKSDRATKWNGRESGIEMCVFSKCRGKGGDVETGTYLDGSLQLE